MSTKLQRTTNKQRTD